jgi:phosphate starvation-inducible protein PhoH and related proteins
MYMPRKTRAKSGLSNEVQTSLERRWNSNYQITNNFVLTDAHKSFLETILNPDTNMCLVNGPAGSAKSYIATLAALLSVKRAAVEEIVYIRSVVESASSKLGFLPGDINEKFHPWSMPLMDKFNELLSPSDAVQIMKSGFVHCIPVNLVRGLTFKKSIVIVDECQNMTKSELITVLTRFGLDSKYVLLGDSRQSDIGGRTGFSKVHEAFKNEKSEGMGIHTFTFTNNEIVRHPLLSHICEVVESISE